MKRLPLIVCLLVSGRALRLKRRLQEDRHGFVLRTPSLTK